ncbi:uncharacterized protein LOC142551475 isoform X2 [Primulina tabacum]|uniref:uncharacterized protein LOC142551475 isoform X2 n=1 Tax=Primulina tabacum TaxID=48773 RepID=UPI003F5A047E
MMDSDRVRVKRKTLEMVLQQCQIAIQQLASGCEDDDDDDDRREDDCELDSVPLDSTGTSSTPAYCDTDTPEFYDVLKSRLECPDFLKKLEKASLPQNMTEESSSWDMISENDLWEGGNVELDSEDYVLVSQEDIMEGIAAFMAAYLSSLKQTKCLARHSLSKRRRASLGRLSMEQKLSTM